MIKESFNPVYNNVEQVKDCATYMLGEEVIDARIAIVIGHNGRSFVSSTDWRLTTISGAHRILPFSMRPQYPSFLECVAGVRYSYNNRRITVEPDCADSVFGFDSFGIPRGTAIRKMREKGAVVKINGESFTFVAGKTLKIYVEPDSKFIATDCVVKCQELAHERVYEVLPDEYTLYGFLDKEGKITQAIK